MSLGGSRESSRGAAQEANMGRKTLATPRGLPKPPPGCREGLLGTELGLDTMRRHSSYSEWSRSLIIAGQGYREECGEVRRKESGERKPRAFCGGENEEYKRPVGLLAWVAAEERGINVSPRTASQSAFDPIFPSQLPKTGPSPACNFQWLPTAQSSKGYLLTPASKASTSQAQPIVLA